MCKIDFLSVNFTFALNWLGKVCGTSEMDDGLPGYSNQRLYKQVQESCMNVGCYGCSYSSNGICQRSLFSGLFAYHLRYIFMSRLISQCEIGTERESGQRESWTQFNDNLRSKRFRGICEQRKTEEPDYQKSRFLRLSTLLKPTETLATHASSTSNVSSATLICQFANVKTVFEKGDQMYFVQPVWM